MLKADVEKTNQFILDSFKQTLAYSREEKISSLENTIKEKDNEILELKGEIEKVKEALRVETLEHKLARMDHQNALIQNKNARNSSVDEERTYDPDDTKFKSEKSDRSNSKSINNRKMFKIQSTKPRSDNMESGTKRRTRGAYKKNKAIQALKEESNESEQDSMSNFINDDDEDFEINIEISDDGFDDEERDNGEEEEVIPKRERESRKILRRSHSKLRE